MDSKSYVACRFQWFIHRNSSWLLKDDGKSIRWPHFLCNTSASSRRGSRTHTDGLHKRAPKAHASRGVWRACSPGEGFWIFYSLKPPHSWVSESFRQDISKCSTSNFFPFKIYLFMTDFRKKLETGVDSRLSSTVISWDLEVITWGIRAHISWSCHFSWEDYVKERYCHR